MNMEPLFTIGHWQWTWLEVAYFGSAFALTVVINIRLWLKERRQKRLRRAQHRIQIVEKFVAK